MIQHNFITHETKSLLFLRNSLLRTVKNKACAAIIEPVTDTISQINKELDLRGIKPIRKGY